MCYSSIIFENNSPICYKLLNGKLLQFSQLYGARTVQLYGS